MWNGIAAENREIQIKVCLPFQEETAHGTLKSLGHFQRCEMEEKHKTTMVSRAVVKWTEWFTMRNVHKLL